MSDPSVAETGARPTVKVTKRPAPKPLVGPTTSDRKAAWQNLPDYDETPDYTPPPPGPAAWQALPDYDETPMLPGGTAEGAPGLPSAEAREFSARPVEGPARAAVQGFSDFSTSGLTPAMQGAAEASQAPPPKGYQPVTQGNQPLPVDPETQNLMRIGEGIGRLTRNWLDGSDPAAKEAYERGRKSTLANQQLLEHEHFVPYLLGQIGAAAASAYGGGEAAVAKGLTAAGVRAHGLFRQAINAGLTGVQTAMYGAGSDVSEGKSGGEIAADVPKQFATGAVVGPVVHAAGNLGGKLVRAGATLARGAAKPAETGQRIAANAIAEDFADMGSSIGPEAEAAARKAGLKLYPVDYGAASSRAQTRASMNVSPRARNTVEPIVEERRLGRNDRLMNFIGRWGGDPTKVAQAVERARKAGLPPLYKRAYAAGDREIKPPEDLLGSKTFATAVQHAIDVGQDWAVKEGVGAFNPRVKVENGIISFTGKKGVPQYPNIQFWDYVQRSLREAAEGANSLEAKARIAGVRDRLLDYIDKEVPEFAQARATGSWFFGASNALEAGQKFVRETSLKRLAQAQKAIASFDPAQRQLFSQGFAQQLAQDIGRTNYSHSIIEQAFHLTPNARKSILTALGADKMNELEALLHAEGIAEKTYRAATGNSTTAQQLADQHAGKSVAMFEALHAAGIDPYTYITSMLGQRAFKAISKDIDKGVAQHTVEMLFGDFNDPKVRAALQAVTKNSRTMEFIRNLHRAIENVAPHDIGPENTAAGAATIISRHNPFAHHEHEGAATAQDKAMDQDIDTMNDTGTNQR